LVEKRVLSEEEEVSPLGGLEALIVIAGRGI